MPIRSHSPSRDVPIQAPGGGFAGYVGRLLRRLARMAELRRQRRQLARLEDHLLDDIGLTRDEVASELRRSIWK